jgi:DNA-binding MarR family transcriptional regulator
MKSRDLYVSPKKMKSYINSKINKMLKDQDFTASQIPYILEIGDNEGTSMKQLSMSLGADKGLTTRVIKALIKNGFVANNIRSGPTYSLCLTDKGREAYNLSTTIIDNALNDLLECLSDDDMEHFKAISAKINKRLDELYEY